MVCVRSWKLFRGSKSDRHSRMIYFRMKLMESEWLGKKLFRKNSKYHGWQTGHALYLAVGKKVNTHVHDQG